MITDFPKQKKHIKKVIDMALREKVKQGATLASMINKKKMHEGDKMGILHADGKLDVSEMNLIESEFTVPKKDVPTITPEEIMTKIDKVADDMAGQMERNLFQALDKGIKEAGRTMPGNPQLTPETMLDALEMIFITFEDDDRQKSSPPSVITSPEVAAKFRELEAAATQEQKDAWEKRRQEILDRKYKEYMDDLNSRKIVD
jgi:hypothetical protein